MGQVTGQAWTESAPFINRDHTELWNGEGSSCLKAARTVLGLAGGKRPLLSSC